VGSGGVASGGVTGSGGLSSSGGAASGGGRSTFVLTSRAFLDGCAGRHAELRARAVRSEQANANFATTGDDGYFGPHLPCNVLELQLYALSLDTFSPTDPDSSVLVSIELQDLGEVLGVARLTGRAGDYGTTCVAP